MAKSAWIGHPSCLLLSSTLFSLDATGTRNLICPSLKLHWMLTRSLRVEEMCSKFLPSESDGHCGASGSITTAWLAAIKGLLLYDHVRKLIHELAVAYEVPTLHDLPGETVCRFCAALAAEGKLDAYPAEPFIRDFRRAP
jgi:hypothetical protein